MSQPNNKYDFGPQVDKVALEKKGTFPRNVCNYVFFSDLKKLGEQITIVIISGT